MWSRCPCESSTATGRSPCSATTSLDPGAALHARVDDDRLAVRARGQDPAVGPERAGRESGDEHARLLATLGRSSGRSSRSGWRADRGPKGIRGPPGGLTAPASRGARAVPIDSDASRPPLPREHVTCPTRRSLEPGPPTSDARSWPQRSSSVRPHAGSSVPRSAGAGPASGSASARSWPRSRSRRWCSGRAAPPTRWPTPPRRPSASAPPRRRSPSRAARRPRRRRPSPRRGRPPRTCPSRTAPTTSSS